MDPKFKEYLDRFEMFFNSNVVENACTILSGNLDKRAKPSTKKDLSDFVELSKDALSCLNQMDKLLTIKHPKFSDCKREIVNLRIVVNAFIALSDKSLGIRNQGLEQLARLKEYANQQ